MEQQQVIAVVGAGTMGHGFAQIFAQYGHPVRLVDRTAEAANAGREMIKSNLAVVVEVGFITAEQARDALERVQVVTTLKEAVADAGFVIEAVFESLPVKLECWSSLSELCSRDAIIASNTSSFDIEELARVLASPERAIGTHWFNPPQIVPCVEVIPGRLTSSTTVERTLSLLRSVGKEPAITKSVPGFVANRIQLVMAAEAFRCLEEGVATAEDIDRIVKTSFGFRLGVYGVFEIADLAGLDTYVGVYDYLSARYGDERYRAPALLRKLVEAGSVGVKAGSGIYQYTDEEAKRLRAERDRKLYEQLRAYRAEQGGTRGPAVPVPRAGEGS